MEISFPLAIDALKKTAETLTYSRQPVAHAKKEKLAGLLEFLQTRLIQFNDVVNTGYRFGDDLGEDIIQYTSCIKENESALTELVEYLLCRDQISPDSYTKYEVLHLREVLLGIKYNSDTIMAIVGNNVH